MEKVDGKMKWKRRNPRNRLIKSFVIGVPTFISPTDIDLRRKLKTTLLHLCWIGSKLALRK